MEPKPPKTWTAVFNIGLLLSLHMHPVIASHVSSSDDSATAAVPFPEGNEVDAHAVASIMQTNESVEENLEGWMDCGIGYSTTMRYYYFELDLHENDGESVVHYAMELVRSPRAPRLRMYPGQTWSVALTDDDDHPLDWVLTPIEGSVGGQEVEIDLLYDVNFLKQTYVDGDAGLHIGMKDGSDFKFTGGLYYPQVLLAQAMKKGDKGPFSKPKKEDEVMGGQKEATEVVAGESSALHAARSGRRELTSAVMKHTAAFAGKGIVGGLTVGIGLSVGFSSCVALMNGILNSFLASVGVQSTIQVSIGIAPLTMAQIFTFSTYAGGLGLLGGIAVGLGIGLAVGIPVGAAQMIRQLVKQHRELGLSASEKVFQKLYCHRQYKRCNKKTVVPYNMECPSR